MLKLPHICVPVRTLYYGCILLFALPFCSPSLALAGGDSLVDQVESMLPPHVGAAVMAIDRGKTVFKHAWGKRQLGRPELCTPATNFRLASVSKQFTATAILLLVDRGKIALEDTLDSFFSECPSYWSDITVHHLLTHTSGVPDYEKLIPEGTSLQLSDINVLQLLRTTEKALFKPGDRFAYSNSGYTLLGLIVEIVADRSFHGFMNEEVFHIAGMKQSVLYVAGINEISERAIGHEVNEAGQWLVADQSVTSAIRGDGGVYSSLNDLERWMYLMDDGQLLSRSIAEARWKPHIKTDRGDHYYGYGWFVGEYRGELRIMHGGSTRGFSSMLQCFPERQAAVAILLNRSSIGHGGGFDAKIVDLLVFKQDK